MPELTAFIQVVLIDLVLAGDNAVVVGALAAGLPPGQRRRVITFGVMLAVIARIIMSVGILWLLKLPGVRIVGGVLLLWVAWKMFRDLTSDNTLNADNSIRVRSFTAAVWAVCLADVSMSLDNVLGVAAAAAGHIPALVAGLILSVTLMGVAANWIAKLINKHIWIAYLGLALILFIALKMTYQGVELLHLWG